ncbi:MAG: DnaJ domain-containing protein [SAR324 cluster bacterium]|nr:DnaJ domain-containing protein [SAR324 cluster bacterium]
MNGSVSPCLRVLELDNSASATDIKKAYRRLVHIHHPDKGGNSEMFFQIQNAYEQARQLVA